MIRLDDSALAVKPVGTAGGVLSTASSVVAHTSALGEERLPETSYATTE